MNNDWQPAVIAPSSHVLKYHFWDPGRVTKFAGEKVRVRDAGNISKLNEAANRQYGCKGRHVEVHPDDVRKFWPEIQDYNVALCTCEILTD